MINLKKAKLLVTAVHERMIFLIKGDYKRVPLFNTTLKNYCFENNTSDDTISLLKAIFHEKCALGASVNPTGDDDTRVFLFKEDIHRHPILRKLQKKMSKSVNQLSDLSLGLGFIMINETTATTGGRGSGGGWHRDSAYGQLKVMIYLNDVSESNGPFQIIKDTRIFNIHFKYDPYIKKTSPLRLNNDEQLDKEALKITGPSGTTVVFNPENIHRGSPCSTGKRQAATLYFFPKSRLEAMVSENRNDIDRLLM